MSRRFRRSLCFGGSLLRSHSRQKYGELVLGIVLVRAVVAVAVTEQDKSSKALRGFRRCIFRLMGFPAEMQSSALQNTNYRFLEARKARTTVAGSRWLASTSAFRWRMSSAVILLARSASAARSGGNLARVSRRTMGTASYGGK